MSRCGQKSGFISPHRIIYRTGIVVLIAGHTSFAGVCMADPTAWIAALIPLIPYYFHVMKKYKNKSQVQVVED